MALTVNDLGQTTVTDGTATVQVRPAGKTVILLRILIGSNPAAVRTITLRNGDEDTSPIKATIVVPAVPNNAAIPIGIEFEDGLRVMYSGAVDATFVWSS